MAVPTVTLLSGASSPAALPTYQACLRSGSVLLFSESRKPLHWPTDVSAMETKNKCWVLRLKTLWERDRVIEFINCIVWTKISLVDGVIQLQTLILRGNGGKEIRWDKSIGINQTVGS